MCAERFAKEIRLFEFLAFCLFGGDSGGRGREDLEKALYYYLYGSVEEWARLYDIENGQGKRERESYTTGSACCVCKATGGMSPRRILAPVVGFFCFVFKYNSSNDDDDGIAAFFLPACCIFPPVGCIRCSCLQPQHIYNIYIMYACPYFEMWKWISCNAQARKLWLLFLEDKDWAETTLADVWYYTSYTNEIKSLYIYIYAQVRISELTKRVVQDSIWEPDSGSSDPLPFKSGREREREREKMTFGRLVEKRLHLIVVVINRGILNEFYTDLIYSSQG